jgi:hypothetical protein
MTKEEQRIEFFIRVREKFEEIEQLAQEFELIEDYLSILCVGLLEEQEDEDSYRVNAISSIFVDSEQEMGSLLTHLASNYDGDAPDTGSIDFWMGQGGDA